MVLGLWDVSLAPNTIFHLWRDQNPPINSRKNSNHFQHKWFLEISKCLISSTLKICKRRAPNNHEDPSNILFWKYWRWPQYLSKIMKVKVGKSWNQGANKLWNQETKKLWNQETFKPRNLKVLHKLRPRTTHWQNSPSDLHWAHGVGRNFYIDFRYF